MILVLLIGGLMIFGALGIWLLASTSRAQKKAEATAQTFLDATFDGRPDVTVSLNMRTIKYETAISGAKQRGYQLANQNGNQYGASTLMFEKVA
jgi:hypothetical protein